MPYPSWPHVGLSFSRGPCRAADSDSFGSWATLRSLENAPRRRAARELIGAYHEQELRRLLERVREGFARMDAGEIDPFDLDALIHHYKKAVQKLWSFCGSSGGEWERAASTLEFLRERGEDLPDWWAAAERRRR